MNENQAVKVEGSSRGEALRNIFFVGTTIVVAYVLTVVIGIEELQETVEKLGFWGPLAIVLTKITTIVVVPLGGGPVYATAGALFGFWKGLLLTTLGDVLGFSAAFLLSRLFGRSIIDFFVPQAYLSIVDQIVEKAGEAKIFFKARVTFIGFPEIFAYAAGLTSVSYFLFISAQILLHLPAAALVVLFGEALFAGNMLFFLVASAAALLAALVGGYFLHKDFTRVA
jgi:uncharacterized membrane protein YdjX (TVP38/TMEM64 family)